MTDPITTITDLVERITSGKLKQIRVGPKYARTVLRYIDMADELFSPEQEDAAREWVRSQLLEVARNNDIRWLPDWIETPVEQFVINIAVELGWELLHATKLRGALVASAGK